MPMPEWICGNIFIRPNILRQKGDKVHGHKHKFDHMTLVRSGAIHVRAVLETGVVIEREFSADDMYHAHVLIRAGVEHEITALVDNTEFWCIYSHRDPQGRVTQTYTGWDEATH